MANIWGRKKHHFFVVVAVVAMFPNPHPLKKKRGASVGAEQRKGEKWLQLSETLKNAHESIMKKRSSL